MKLLVRLQNSRYIQYFSALIAALGMANLAIYITWPSPSLPQLTQEDSPIGTMVTAEEGSWIAAVFFLGSVPGCITAAVLVEKVGRKNSLLLATIPLFVPWMIIIFAKSALTIIIARIIAGLGAGIVVVVVPVYIGEIAEKDIRGKLGLSSNLLITSGGLFVLSVGPFASYTAFAISCSAFPLIFLILFSFMPKSPYYLIKVGRRDDAKKNLIRLSDNTADERMIQSRLDEIENTVEDDMKHKSTLWELFSKHEYRKPLLILVGVLTLHQFSGVSAMDSYMQTVIQSSKSSISPEVSSILFGLMKLLAVLISATLIDKIGRKPLLIISALGSALALVAEGIYFYLQDKTQADLTNISWLPTTGIIAFLLINNIGVGSVPFVLMGELFPTNIKGMGVSVGNCCACTLGALTIKFFNPISKAWGIYTMFWIFAGCCILGSFFVYFALPETKGKSFAEIQAELNKNRTTIVQVR